MSAYTQLAKWDGESKIEQMDLDQIKTMLCPLSGHDPYKCIGCKSVAGCPAGQRVNVIMEELSKPDKKGIKRNYAGISKARWKATQAKLSGDPIQWIMDNTHCTLKCAHAKFSNWKRDYPDIMGDVVLKKRPSQDPKQKLIEAIKSGDPYKYYRINGNAPKARTDETIRKGLEKWADVRELWEKSGLGKKEEPKVEEEMSIDDFLNTVEQEDIEETTETPAELPFTEPNEETPIEMEKPVETAKKAVFVDTVIGIEFETKGKQLAEKRERLLNEIAERRKELEWIEDRLAALEKVKGLFDPSMAIGE